MIPSCDDDILPINSVFDKHHRLRIVGQREDVFGQLHTVVAGVERAADTAIGGVDWQVIPPL
jgi:hypothetical protein